MLLLFFHEPGRQVLFVAIVEGVPWVRTIDDGLSVLFPQHLFGETQVGSEIFYIILDVLLLVSIDELNNLVFLILFLLLPVFSRSGPGQLLPSLLHVGLRRLRNVPLSSLIVPLLRIVAFIVLFDQVAIIVGLVVAVLPVAELLIKQLLFSLCVDWLEQVILTAFANWFRVFLKLGWFFVVDWGGGFVLAFVDASILRVRVVVIFVGQVLAPLKDRFLYRVVIYFIVFVQVLLQLRKDFSVEPLGLQLFYWFDRFEI